MTATDRPTDQMAEVLFFFSFFSLRDDFDDFVQFWNDPKLLKWNQKRRKRKEEEEEEVPGKRWEPTFTTTTTTALL